MHTRRYCVNSTFSMAMVVDILLRHHDRHRAHLRRCLLFNDHDVLHYLYVAVSPVLLGVDKAVSTGVCFVDFAANCYLSIVFFAIAHLPLPSHKPHTRTLTSKRRNAKPPEEAPEEEKPTKQKKKKAMTEEEMLEATRKRQKNRKDGEWSTGWMKTWHTRT